MVFDKVQNTHEYPSETNGCRQQPATVEAPGAATHASHQTLDTDPDGAFYR